MNKHEQTNRYPPPHRPEIGLRVCEQDDPDKLSLVRDHWLYGTPLLDPRAPEQFATFDNSWLFDRLRKKYRLSMAAAPDVIVCGYLLTRASAREAFLKFRQRFGFRPYLGMACMEKTTIGPSLADFSISLRPTAGDNFYLPIFNLSCLDEYEQWRSGRFVREIARRRAIPKPRFCLFLHSHAKASPDAREDFFRRLSRYKSIDSPGVVLNNMLAHGFGPLRKEETLGADPWALRARYKFTMAFENKSSDYYLTEKIRMALMAGSIPIYWGCPQVAEYINPACFVNCHDYPDFDAVVERVKQIDQDPELYERYRSAPLLLPDSKLHDSSPARLAAFMEGVIEKALARRQSRGAAVTLADRRRYAGVAAKHWRKRTFRWHNT